MPAMTLATSSTCRNPFYARLGFVHYPEHEWGEGHHAIWRNQLDSAFDCSRRFR